MGRDEVFVIVKLDRSIVSAHETIVKPALNPDGTDCLDWTASDGWQNLPDLTKEEAEPFRIPQLVVEVESATAAPTEEERHDGPSDAPVPVLPGGDPPSGPPPPCRWRSRASRR